MTGLGSNPTLSAIPVSPSFSEFYILGVCRSVCDMNLAPQSFGQRKSPQSPKAAVQRGFRSECPEVSILGIGMGESVQLSPIHFVPPRARTV
jgi:hypothetical protein